MTSNNRAPTIKTVAREAGVSIKTVSRVMNAESGVRPGTTARVQSAADRLGYVVNPAARRLASGRTHTLGVVIYASSHWQWTAELISGALAGARRRGYGLGPFILQHYEKAEREIILELASGRAVDGVILTVPWNENLTLHEELAARGMPIALLPAPAGSAHCAVRSDDDRGAALLTRRLLEFGHREIAVIGGQETLDLTRLRLSGVREAMDAAAAPLAPERLVFEDYTFRTGYRAAKRLLASKTPPTAILCFSDILAAGALRASHELGIHPPIGLSIVGMGNQAIAELVWPPLTTIDIPSEEMAAKAADLLIDQIEGVTGAPGEALFNTRLVARGSDGPAPS
ncbi:MAG: LacI family DNA-binding transcriptional regulator [Caulobacteraceae bacterium]|nr:LacI family DNA-binding transcriptional regulator [Caulobacteraceae bacterium]